MRDGTPREVAEEILADPSIQRHLEALAARVRAIYDREARERHEQLSGRPAEGKPPASLPGVTSDARDAAGKAVGVSGKSVDHASKVLRLGTPELVAAVDQKDEGAELRRLGNSLATPQKRRG